MERIRHWWGWEIQENGQIIGAIDNANFPGWGAFSATRKLLGECRTRAEAIALVLNPPTQENPLFGHWVSANEIREQMTDAAFRVALFNGEIVILDSNLGQPRHGEPIGDHRLFFLGRA